MITKQEEYCRLLVTHIQVLIWASKSRSPLWEVWKKCQPALNEELCEQQLSSLARVIRNDTTGGKLAFTDNQFKLGSLVSEILRRWEPDRMTDERNTRKKWRDFIDPDDEDVKQVELYFKTRIRQLKTTGQFLSYTGTIASWTSARHGADSYQYVMPSTTFLSKTSGKFIARCKRVRNLAFGRWVEVNSEHWSAEIEGIEEEPLPVPDANELWRALDGLAAEPDQEDVGPESPSAEEPSDMFPDFHDQKVVDEARHSEMHPSIINFIDEGEPERVHAPSSSSSSSSIVTSKKQKKQKVPRKKPSTSSFSAVQSLLRLHHRTKAKPYNKHLLHLLTR